MVAIRGLYYSYIITSQFYLIRFITNNINAFNKLDIVVELDIVVKLVIELLDTIIVIERYIGSTTFFYITNYYKQLFYSRSYTKYKTFFSAFFIKRSI